MIKKIAFFLFLVVILPVSATDYDQLAVKAQRFYHYGEWPSAIAMYQLMLEQKPGAPSTYCHAIMASAKLKQPAEEMRYLRQSMNAGVPLDSVYDGVQTLAFHDGNATLYENFLKEAGKTYPWLNRNINARLLDYYCWRNDATGMITYADKMLTGAPNNIKFLTALADGCFMNGFIDRGLIAYQTILSLQPDNYHALLVLGNYYFDRGVNDHSDKEAQILAAQYLSKAYTLHPTPYLKTRIESLHRQ